MFMTPPPRLAASLFTTNADVPFCHCSCSCGTIAVDPVCILTAHPCIPRPIFCTGGASEDKPADAASKTGDAVEKSDEKDKGKDKDSERTKDRRSRSRDRDRDRERDRDRDRDRGSRRHSRSRSPRYGALLSWGCDVLWGCYCPCPLLSMGLGRVQNIQVTHVVGCLTCLPLWEREG